MPVRAGSVRGDPLADAVVQRGLAVERGGDFHAHPGRFADHAAEKADIEFTGLCGTGADFDLYARSPQPRKALTRDQRVGVGDGGNHLLDAGCNQRVATGAGAAVVGARLQRDPSRGAGDRVAPRRRIPQCHDFGVRAAGALGVALAENTAVGV